MRFNERSLENFVEPWRVRSDVISVVLTGSHVTGYANKFSDVDLLIVLSDDSDWKESGARAIGGTLFEYFALPGKEIKRALDQDLQEYRFIARMLAIGKVLFDKKGGISTLQKEARAWLDKKPPRRDEKWIAFSKYHVWDNLEGLRALYAEKSIAFDYQYNVVLFTTYSSYANFLQTELVYSSRIDKYLQDAAHNKAYKFKNFPDNRFVNLFLHALKAESRAQKMRAGEKLANYVLGKLGGFKIDGWKFREKLQT